MLIKIEVFYLIFVTWNDILTLLFNQPWWVQKNYVMPIRNTFELSSCFQFKNLIFIIALIQPVENDLNQPLLLMIQTTTTVVSKTSKQFVEKRRMIS